MRRLLVIFAACCGAASVAGCSGTEESKPAKPTSTCTQKEKDAADAPGTVWLEEGKVVRVTQNSLLSLVGMTSLPEGQRKYSADSTQEGLEPQGFTTRCGGSNLITFKFNSDGTVKVGGSSSSGFLTFIKGEQTEGKEIEVSEKGFTARPPASFAVTHKQRP